MAAPTWPPTPEEAHRLTMEEYGLKARDLGLETEDDAEQKLLSAYLFEPPPRLVGGVKVGTPLAVVQRRVQAWLRMVTGLDFTIACSDIPATDGKSLFLPFAAPAPEHTAQDERLFRAMGLVQLGLSSMGFFDSRSALERLYRDWVLRTTWQLLACRAVIAAWSRRFPGIARDLAEIGGLDKAGELRVSVSPVPREGLPEPFLPLYRGLCDHPSWPRREDPFTAAAVAAVDGARSVEEARLMVLGQAQRLRERFRSLRLGPPPVPLWLGVVRPEWILADLGRDVAAEEAWKLGANRPLAMLRAAVAERAKRVPLPQKEAAPSGLRDRLKRRLLGDDPAVGAMPAYGPLRDEAPADVAPPEEDGGRDYDEWDGERGEHRLREVRVYTPESPPGPLASYERIAAANAMRIRQIRRRFAALRVEERWVGGLPDGPEVDLDRAIVAFSDIAAGQQPRDDLYRRFVRRRQPLVVLVLVDLSGSTQGHVIHLEQEALVLVSEGLRAVGLPHGIFGFSSDNARRCNLWRIKDFDEGYGEPVLKRLGNLRAGGSTRLGAFIRHARTLLDARSEPRRLLLILSDGRPEDRGVYRGAYGVADSAMAVREASSAGIYVCCASLDGADNAEQYLSRIFGPGRYLRLRDPDQLPDRLPELLRDLIG